MLTDLEIAAYMHDLGKIGVPESILGKPGKLTDAEFEEDWTRIHQDLKFADGRSMNRFLVEISELLYPERNLPPPGEENPLGV